MNFSLLGFWALVGWCGNEIFPIPRWLRFLNPQPLPPEEPRPFGGAEPAPWIIKLTGTIGGLIGGMLYNQLFPIQGVISGQTVAPTIIGALIGSIFLTDLYDITNSSMRSANRSRSIQTNRF